MSSKSEQIMPTFKSQKEDQEAALDIIQS